MPLVLFDSAVLSCSASHHGMFILLHLGPIILGRKNSQVAAEGPKLCVKVHQVLRKAGHTKNP